jgi:hypothetical protein
MQAAVQHYVFSAKLKSKDAAVLATKPCNWCRGTAKQPEAEAATISNGSVTLATQTRNTGVVFPNLLQLL